MEDKKIADNHGKKHTRNSNKVDAKNVKSKNKPKKKREVMKNWGNVAGFNEKYTKYYYQALAEAVAVMKDSNNITVHFVDFGEIVGIDKGSDKHGEETEVVELYGNVGGTGEFHMRPKARSKIAKEAIILRVSEYRQKKAAEKEKKEVKHKGRQANEKDRAALISLAAQFLDDVAPEAAKILVDTIFSEAEELNLSAERIKDRVVVFASILNVVSNLEEDFLSDNVSSLPIPVPKLKEGESIHPELTMGEVDFLKMLPRTKTTTSADSKETGTDDLASALAKANEIREQALACKEEHPDIAIKLLRQSFNECRKFSESSDADKMCEKIKYNIFQIGLHLMINKESHYLSDANKFDEALDLLDKARHLVSDNYDYTSKMKKWTQKVLNRIKELDTEYRHKKMAFISSGEKSSIKNRAGKSDSKEESKTSAVATHTELNVPGDDSCLFWSVALGVLIPLLNDRAAYREAFKRLFVAQDDMQDDNLFDIYGEGLKERIQIFTATNDTSLIEKQSEDDPFYRLINHYFRQKVASYIALNPKTYTHTLLNRTNEAYVDALRSPNSWGGQIEMHAIFRLLGGNYQLEVEGVAGSKFPAPGKPIINLVFVNAEKGSSKKGSSDPQNHYNVRMPTLLPVASTKDSKLDGPLKPSQNREKSVLEKNDKTSNSNSFFSSKSNSYSQAPPPPLLSSLHNSNNTSTVDNGQLAQKSLNPSSTISSSSSSSSVSVEDPFIGGPGGVLKDEDEDEDMWTEQQNEEDWNSSPKGPWS